MSTRKPETSAEWHARLMRETEGMTKPGEILAHLAADHLKNGPPPAPTAEDLERLAELERINREPH